MRPHIPDPGGGPSTGTGHNWDRILMGIQWGRICPELRDTECIHTGGTNLKSNLSLFSRFPHVLPVAPGGFDTSRLGGTSMVSYSIMTLVPNAFYYAPVLLPFALGNGVVAGRKFLRAFCRNYGRRSKNPVERSNEATEFLGTPEIWCLEDDKDLLVAWLCKVRYTWQQTFLLVDPRWVLGLIHLHQKFHCRWTVNLTASIKGALAFDMFACSGCIRAEHSNTSPMFWLRLNTEESLVSGNVGQNHAKPQVECLFFIGKIHGNQWDLGVPWGSLFSDKANWSEASGGAGPASPFQRPRTAFWSSAWCDHCHAGPVHLSALCGGPDDPTMSPEVHDV